MPHTSERVLVLLRGINVGGRHAVPMAALRELFATLGCTEIATYIQSGNVVCTAPLGFAPSSLASALESRFGFPIPVATRTLDQLSAAIEQNPFAVEQTSLDQLHTVFLENALPPGTLQALEARRAGDERIAAHGRELFLYLPHGSGRSRLALACTAASMPGSPTVRNWKTVLQLHAMLRA